MSEEVRIIACAVSQLRPGDKLRLSAYHMVPDYWPVIKKTNHLRHDQCLVHVEGIDHPLMLTGVVHCVWGDWKLDSRGDTTRAVRS